MLLKSAFALFFPVEVAVVATAIVHPDLSPIHNFTYIAENVSSHPFKILIILCICRVHSEIFYLTLPQSSINIYLIIVEAGPIGAHQEEQSRSMR
jgi:hypothetical protein